MDSGTGSGIARQAARMCSPSASAPASTSARNAASAIPEREMCARTRSIGSLSFHASPSAVVR